VDIGPAVVTGAADSKSSNGNILPPSGARGSAVREVTSGDNDLGSDAIAMSSKPTPDGLGEADRGGVDVGVICNKGSRSDDDDARRDREGTVSSVGRRAGAEENNCLHQGRGATVGEAPAIGGSAAGAGTGASPRTTFSSLFKPMTPFMCNNQLGAANRAGRLGGSATAGAGWGASKSSSSSSSSRSSTTSVLQSGHVADRSCNHRPIQRE
jgi:hypothetical protein